MEKVRIKNKESARGMAIRWQSWQAERKLSYSEMNDWHNFFQKLAKKFKLKKEFRENGII